MGRCHWPSSPGYCYWWSWGINFSFQNFAFDWENQTCFRRKTQLNEIGLVVFAEGSVGVEQETCRLICGSKPKVPPPSLDQSKLITQPDIIRPRNVERTNKSTIIEVTDKQEREIQIWFKYTFSTAPICSLGGRATPWELRDHICCWQKTFGGPTEPPRISWSRLWLCC